MIFTGPLRRTEVPVKRISGTNMGGVLDMSMRGAHSSVASGHAGHAEHD